ncbi:hypothetical protein LINPERPRIM_LOCUS20081 [Linum perenne]
MTSASELFYQRRSRVGRPSTELPLALDPSGSDRGLHLNYGRRHHHNHHGNHSVHGHSNTNGRHDLDGCDPLRRSLHVRHNCHRVSVSHFDSVMWRAGSRKPIDGFAPPLELGIH